MKKEEEKKKKMKTIENDDNKMENSSKNLQKNPKQNAPYPSDLLVSQAKASRISDQRNNQRISSSSAPINPALMMKQKLKINRNLSRPLATLGGQIAQIYKSKGKNQFVSPTTSSNQEHHHHHQQQQQQQHDQTHIENTTNSSKVHKFSRTMSHDPTSLTSTNSYLISPQPLPQYSSGSLRPNKNRKIRTQLTTDLTETHYDDDDDDNLFTETEKDPSELQSPISNESSHDNPNISIATANNTNRTNTRRNSASFVRLNLNSAGDQTKSKFLETET